MTYTPCYCDCCPRTLCVRCCSMGFMAGTADSEAFTAKLMEQIVACNAKGAHGKGTEMQAVALTEPGKSM